MSYIFSDRVTFEHLFHFETGRPTEHLGIKMHLSLAVLISFCSAYYSGRIEITIIFCAASLWHRHSLNTKIKPTYADFAMVNFHVSISATGTGPHLVCNNSLIKLDSSI